MENLVKYIRHSREEITKVIFPSKEQIRGAYFSVFLVVTVIALFLALVDWISTSLISSVLN